VSTQRGLDFRPRGGAEAAEAPTASRGARRAIGVAHLVQQLNAGLQELFPGRFWVEGEVANYKVIQRGHAFFSLKEETSQVSAVIWASARVRLRFAPEDGAQVLALVRKVDFYGPQGRLQLQVDDLEPCGAGALAKALEERRTRLRAEGIFDEARKRPLPALPRVVGIATAAKSAALRDILEILQQRFAERRMLIRPCRVQGEGAAEDIAAALDDLNRDGTADVIILGRGGGSQEDLWCFNEEVVVRAIARSRIPVIAGIGHEVDTTLADFAADVRVATPTAAAQRCLPDRRELEERLEGYLGRLRIGLSKRLELSRVRLRACDGALADPRSIVTERRLRLDAFATRARQALQRLTPDRRSRLERAVGRLRARLPRTDLHGKGLDQLAGRLDAGMSAALERTRAELTTRAGQIQALSPLAVLARGFAVPRDADGSIVRDANTLSPGDELSLRFAVGSARTRVIEVRSTDDEKES